ncbi:hypothetical protein GTY65_07155 [Streptomyces sp. SID8379]|uniref:hypothetical protein n=1 Tax=unclassified Streptomyces TaxID=2593676 RepID=UPI00036725E7|nr:MULTISPECIES: hypothetical protein [unclassified Streptomyces]MYW63849.1 hypothetical protein [Streptomyces sp. SID8379]
MSAAPSPAAPGPRARAWARALLLVVALLFTPLAAASAEAAAPPPAAAAACEPGDPSQDTFEAAVRLSGGHHTRPFTAPPPRRPLPAAAPLAPAPANHPARLSHRALRTVVLRC